MMRSSRLLVCAALAFACGGSPKPAAAPSENEPTATPPTPSTPSTGQRGASPTLRRHWTLGRDVPFASYVDADGLLKTELFAVIAPLVLSREEVVANAAQRECLKDLVAGARELVGGGDGKRNLLVARFEPSTLATAAGACLALSIPLEKTTVADAVEAYTHEGSLLVTTPELLFYGTRAEVTSALAGNAPDGAWPAGIELGPHQYLACRGTNGTDTSGTCGLSVTPEQVRFGVRLDLPDERSAKVGVEVLQQLLMLTGANGPLRGFSYEQKGPRLDVALEARGSTLEQAQQLGTVSALVIHGVRKYIHNAKQAEARTNVARIAQAVIAASRKKLASYPAVPAAIPRGKRYQSAPSEWKAWEPLGFALQGPQYYQYEVVAAPDGKSAEVIARGDLDDDGRPSKFLLRVKLENGSVTPETSIETTEPEE